MFELFQIFTTGGIVLWSKSNNGSVSGHDAVTSLISDLLIGDKTYATDNDLEDFYRNDTHTIRFSRVNSLGIIFVCVYQSILQLSYAEELITNIKAIFLSLFKLDLLESKENKEPYPINLDYTKFSEYFDLRVSELEKSSLATTKPVAEKIESAPTVSATALPTFDSDTEVGSGNSTPTFVPGGPGPRKKNKRGGKKHKKASQIEGAGNKKKQPAKKMRKWTADGLAEEVDDDSDNALDYSGGKGQQSSVINDSTSAEIDMDSYGKSNQQGDFLVNDLADEMGDLLKFDEDEDKEEQPASKLSFGFLQKFMGGKTLTQDDLNKTMEATRTQLMQKNVAPDVAESLCDNVRNSLVGSKTKSWTSVQATVQTAMAEALRRVLTPNTSADLLLEIRKKQKANARYMQQGQKDKVSPYVISVVGVNGVGKSTNLSKIAFWLLQNKFKVLIAACDTFRSGAVEQLKVHVTRLRELTERNHAGHIDMFEEGYGKDAAVIAQHAIDYGRNKQYDIVLIDTAGRRHNDDRLMSSLEKFGKLANPDKIVMVGEALVGTDSVQQARNFNNAFGPNRNLDFFLISKCDTVGEMVGSLVNMTYSTGIPVLFVGTGQNYTDLRTLSVEWAVQLLMK